MPDDTLTIDEEPVNPELVGVNRTGEEADDAIDSLSDENERIRKLALKRFDNAWTADQDDREMAQKVQRFRYPGQQWNKDFRDQREAAGLPCLESPRLDVYVRRVTGDARQNRPQIKIIPASTDATPEIADTLEGKIREIWNSSFGDTAADHALDTAAGCGRGFFRVVNDCVDDESFTQVLKIQRIKDAFSVVFDQSANEHDGSDSMFYFITGTLPRGEFLAKWPDAVATDFNTNDYYSTDWLNGDQVRYAEYHWKEPGETYTLYRYADGSVSRDKQRPNIDTGVMEKPIQSRKVTKMKTRWCIMSGAEILDGPHDWIGEYIPVIPVWGEELVIDGVRRTKGVIHDSMDMQTWLNYATSVDAERLVMTPKAPYLVTAPMIKDNIHQWNAINNRSMPFVVYTPDPSAPTLYPRREEPVGMDTGVQQSMVNAIEAINGTTGLENPAMGKPDPSVKSGIHANTLAQASDIGTFGFPDNLTRAYQFCGKVLIDLIPKLYPDCHKMRVMKEDGTVDWISVNEPILRDNVTGEEISYDDQEMYLATHPGAKLIDGGIRNNLKQGRYAVVISTGPNYKTQRIEGAQRLAEVMQAVPAAAPLIMDLAVGNMDFHDADVAAKRLKTQVPPEVVAAGEGKEYQPQQGIDPATGLPISGMNPQMPGVPVNG